jgi:hypothetical protein
MSDRRQKRILDKEAAAVTRKAKVDMERYVLSLSELPSEREIRAWQAGYIAGINRGSNNQ